MVISYAKLTIIGIANISLFSNEYKPGSPVINTDITQQEDNDGNDNTEIADNNNSEDANEINGNSIHDEELPSERCC
eukprot:2266979-Ditylum_brightwellii.AAC.1